MADRGHELTEEILRGIEADIAREFKQASEEVAAKAKAYLDETERDRQEQEARWKSGEITREDYQNWCFRHTMMGERWTNLRDNLAADLHNAKEIATDIAQGKMPDVFALNGNFALYQIESGAEIGTGLAMYNHDTAVYLLSGQRQLMPGPSDAKAKEIAANKDMQWNAQHIQSAVLQGVLQGETPQNVAQRLMQVGQMDYNAAVRYARTMTTSAQNAGRYDAYRRVTELGVKLVIEWEATMDDRTRDAHRMMHGERTTVDEPFETPDGYEIYYPADCSGASDAPQSEIWNCRCTLLAWVEGFEGETVRSSPGLGDMTFEEWQEGSGRYTGAESEKLTKAEFGFTSRQNPVTIGLTSINSTGQVLNPMPRSEYETIKAALERNGVEVRAIFPDSEDDTFRLMRYFGAEASYSDNLIKHLDAIPSRGVFFEEIIHWSQARRYGELEPTDNVERAAREIEAARKLLRCREVYGLDELDVASIQRNLAEDEEAFLRATGMSYDESHYRG